MARDFRARFLGANVKDRNAAVPKGAIIASVYLRYSSEKSNPRSLIQQLQRCLKKAHSNKHFIPLDCVFADAAVTGMTAGRRGYEMAKASLTDASAAVQVLYIDEIGRASRDAIEALTLGRFITSLHKRFIGASDGFDSELPMSKMMLSVFAMLHEWFIDQLRSKVNRGLDDAFEIGGNLGLPATGYKLKPLTDENDRVVCGKDGVPRQTLAVDDEQKQYVLLAFDLYAEKGWSKAKIARHFNDLKVGAFQTWDDRRIHQLLTRFKYVGILTFRMTYKSIDPVSGKITIVKRPKNEWKVKRASASTNYSMVLMEENATAVARLQPSIPSTPRPKSRRTRVAPMSIRRLCFGRFADHVKMSWIWVAPANTHQSVA